MKNTIRNIIVAFLIINSSIFSAKAQDTKVTGDLEQWTSIEISKNLGKRWNISLDQQLRFIQDITRFDVYFADLGVDFKINKHFSIGANYRLYQNKNNDGHSNKHIRYQQSPCHYLDKRNGRRAVPCSLDRRT